MKESKEIVFQNESTHPIGDNGVLLKAIQRFLENKSNKKTKVDLMDVAIWLVEFTESQLAPYKETNQTLRDQIKQFEKIPGLKELKEENERLRNKHDAAVKRGRGYAAERYEDGYKLGKIHGQEEQENRIKELEEGIKKVKKMTLTYHKWTDAESALSEVFCDLDELLTKDTKNK